MLSDLCACVCTFHLRDIIVLEEAAVRYARPHALHHCVLALYTPLLMVTSPCKCIPLCAVLRPWAHLRFASRIIDTKLGKTLTTSLDCVCVCFLGRGHRAAAQVMADYHMHTIV